MKNKWLMWLLSFFVILSGCHIKKQIQIDVFYSKTCASCQMLENGLLKKLEAMDYEIILHDIDEEENIDFYLDIIDALDNPASSLKTNLSVPLIVYIGQFAAVGYDPSIDEALMTLIDAANHNQIDSTNLPSGVWTFKEE